MPFVILPTNSASGGYDLTNSLRFNSGSSDYLSRTLSTNGNKRTFTFSCWLKRSSLSAEQRILMAFTGGGAQEWIPQISSANKIKLSGDTGSGYNFDLDSDAVFRDVSAWYHIVVAVDTTQATSSNRIILYVNGLQQTLTGSYPSQNFDFVFLNTSGTTLLIGGRTSPSGLYLNGYLSDVFFIDGQQLAPTSFAESDFDTGIWKPKAYTGTYGTNGYYLQFKNSGSLGTDSSGNGNTFTVNNLTSVDQSTDTPTNNFCTLSGLAKGSALSLSNGNLTCNNDSTWRSVMSTIAVSKGKWYWEAKVVSLGTINFGVTKSAQDGTTHSSVDAGRVMYSSNGNVYDEGFTSSTYATGTTFTTNDIIGLGLDCDNGTLRFYKNGSLIYTYSNAGLTTNEMTPANGVNSATGDMNFGSPPYSANSYTDGAGRGNFSYAVPSGYFSLCTANLSLYG
jgi:hypothetical protein